MNIALDSNVIIRDSWFRSQRTRALLDYLAATPWHLVITEVVEAEVRAHVRREIEKVLKQVATGLEKAEKLGVSDLPTVDVQTTLERTMEQWEQHWHQFLDSASADRITIGAEEAAEAVRRAAERVAPCSAKGEGIRDALIWLTLVRVARGNGEDSKLAFISENY